MSNFYIHLSSDFPGFFIYIPYYMKNKYITEILWFCLPILMALVFLKFDISEESTFDINIHDTYYVMRSIDLFYTLSISLGCIIMLIRAIVSGFKNNFKNINFLIYAFAFILIWTFFISIHNMMSTRGGWTIYPPLSGVPDNMIEIEDKSFLIDSFYLYIILAITIVLVIFAGYKTGLNTGKQKENKF